MINKLESAGLGFYVKANETQQKLGESECNPYCINDIARILLMLKLHSGIFYSILIIPKSIVN